MALATLPERLSSARSGAPHIVDVLIAERAPRLSASPVWPVLKPLLYAVLDYRKARRAADAMAPMPGAAAMDYLSGLLRLKVAARGLDHIPRQGRLVVICNHPTGIADGIAVYDVLKTIRRDLVFYANADARRVAPGFDDVLIPVEWVEAKRTREKTKLTLVRTREVLEAEAALVIFPAGRLARRAPDGTLTDPPWMASAVSIARKYEAPVVPAHLAGPWSTLFHLFHRFSEELRDITLFHELLNKQGRAYSLTFGPLIPHETIEGEAAEIAERLKAYVERVLPARPEAAFA